MNLPYKVFFLNPDILYKNIKNEYPFKSAFKPYTKKDIEYTINYFETTEEYEKCDFLKKFMEKRYKGMVR